MDNELTGLDAILMQAHDEANATGDKQRAAVLALFGCVLNLPSSAQMLFIHNNVDFMNVISKAMERIHAEQFN